MSKKLLIHGVKGAADIFNIFLIQFHRTSERNLDLTVRVRNYLYILTDKISINKLTLCTYCHYPNRIISLN